MIYMVRGARAPESGIRNGKQRGERASPRRKEGRKNKIARKMKLCIIIAQFETWVYANLIASLFTHATARAFQRSGVPIAPSASALSSRPTVIVYFAVEHNLIK